MAKNSKEAYKLANEQYLEELSQQPGVRELTNGILYRILTAGKGKSPNASSVVSVYYKGSLINGKVFDDNTRNKVCDAFRLRDLIVGWQIALKNMHEGDRWQLYIPAAYGYGPRGTHGIPGNSTLIFDIQLLKVH
ncbi:MAG: FKBP-type peptidyl-prolyl cis-trans isomerase [Muribaculaceae bacterium]|nr:FKBP-type peptidyl-prolyl cis-trans isomerase [Muribaculaceae bacterium]